MDRKYIVVTYRNKTKGDQKCTARNVEHKIRKVPNCAAPAAPF